MSAQNFLAILLLIFVILLETTAIIHLWFRIPYVPSKNRVVGRMIELARLKPKDTVYDLGCGDGRILFAAEKTKGVRAHGFEIAPLVYFLAVLRKLILRSRAKIHFRSLLRADLSRANVIFCYLIPTVMPSLYKKLKHECKKGTRIISNTFHIPGLKPQKIYPKNPAASLPTIYVYRI